MILNMNLGKLCFIIVTFLLECLFIEHRSRLISVPISIPGKMLLIYIPYSSALHLLWGGTEEWGVQDCERTSRSEIYQQNLLINFAVIAECVCGIGCSREFSFEYRNQCEVRLMGIFWKWNYVYFSKILLFQKAISPRLSVPLILVKTLATA